MPVTMHKQTRNPHQQLERRQRMYEFLHTHPVGVLSTVDSVGNPHGMTVYFTVDNQLVFSFLTKTRTRSYDNLEHNGHIMLTVFHTESQTTLQIIGLAKEVAEVAERNLVTREILTASMKTGRSGLPAISKLQVGSHAAFTIRPVQMRMSVFTQPESGGYAELFETIENFELQ
jgi:flavin reductase (DIM6/NTAB) family NADH-FMN oxidoreductase RutF